VCILRRQLECSGCEDLGRETERGDPVRFRTPNLLQKAAVSCGTFAPDLRVGQVSLTGETTYTFQPVDRTLFRPDRNRRGDGTIFDAIPGLSKYHGCADH
jgi:hypothetical protein